MQVGCLLVWFCCCAASPRLESMFTGGQVDTSSVDRMDLAAEPATQQIDRSSSALRHIPGHSPAANMTAAGVQKCPKPCMGKGKRKQCKNKKCHTPDPICTKDCDSTPGQDCLPGKCITQYKKVGPLSWYYAPFSFLPLGVFRSRDCLVVFWR